MGIKFEFLDAGNGDCIWITIDERINILIDGGFKYTYINSIKPRVKELRKKGQKLDLVVLTHYDKDHITGLHHLLVDENNKADKIIIKKLWFNTFGKASFKPLKKNKTKRNGEQQQKKFEKVIEDFPSSIYTDRVFTENIQEPIEQDDIVILSPYTDKNYQTDKVKITLLSPNNKKLEELETKYKAYFEAYSKRNGKKKEKEDDWEINMENFNQDEEKLDNEVANGSSIAFILDYKDKSYLLLGDAHIDLITESLSELYSVDKPLEVEFIKLSHHGSIANISNDFLSLVKSKKFIILAKSPTTHKHPDKKTLVKIIEHYRGSQKKVKFIFNHKIKDIFKKKNLNNPKDKELYAVELFLENELIKNNLKLNKKSRSLEFIYE